MKPLNPEGDRRQFVRQRLSHLAFIRTQGQSLIPCVIRDISAGGALLEFEVTQPAENVFQLITGTALGTVDCEVRHRSRSGIGVQFDQSIAQ